MSTPRRIPIPPRLGELIAAGAEEHAVIGCADTLREILQQPETWVETAARISTAHPGLAAFVDAARPEAVVLTGSGSSLYAGECLAPGLQAALGVPARAIAAGDFLTRGAAALPATGRVLVVHLARSGDSPESRAALESLLNAGDRVRHLIVTCNADGALARAHAGDPRLHRVLLAERTNDRSLVMTSSFTNLVLATRALAWRDDLAGYQAAAARAAELARRVLADHADDLAALAARPFRAAVHLGTAGHFGAAREASLKMLEMSAGRLLAFPETFLGLRHGPMSAVHADTLVVAYTSADPVARGYELDLLRELRRKQPGAPLLVVGEAVPPDALGGGVAIAPAGLDALGDDERVLVHVLCAQLLAFFCCLRLGLRPDAPSPDGAITRVVGDFPAAPMSAVLVVGEINPDLVLGPYQAFPEPGKEVLVDGYTLALGSASAICAVGLARLGARVAFRGKVGDDPWGAFCVDALAAEGVDVGGVARDGAHPTGLTVSITSARDRALVTCLGAITALTAADLDGESFAGFDHLHVSSYFLQAGLRPGCRALLARARRAGLTTSLDPGFDPAERWGDDLRATLDQVDLFFPNEVELRAVTGIADPAEALRRLRSGRTRTVAKLGADGCATLEGDALVRVPAFPVTPVDTTGAGDSFNAGYLHAFLARRPTEECLRWGAACGALSTRRPGGTAGQPRAGEVEAFLRAHP